LAGRLLLSGPDTHGDGCAWLVVNPAPLSVHSSRHASCERPPIAAHSVVAVQFPVTTANAAKLRIARVNAKPGRVSFGPVVMTFNDVSDTHLEWTYGPGSLWIYDVAAEISSGATRRGAEVLDVSTATGRVVRTVSMPRLYEPLLAADADGLWIAASPETGVGTPAPVYRLAPGAHAARLVHSGGYASIWLVAAGHTVWADIGSLRPRSSSIRQEIWRFDGPSGAAHPLASADELNGVTPAVQPGSAALWTIDGVPSHGNYGLCTERHLVRIDARTGRQTVMTTFEIPDEPCFSVGGQTFVAGALYFLDDFSMPEKLYRVRP
jgi:hypothetical protein